MAVRHAVRADLDLVCALVRELADYERLGHEVTFDTAEFDRHLFGPEAVASALIAEDDDTGEVAGFALYFSTFSTFLGRPGIWLEDVFVRPPHRRRGHGRALLDELRRMTPGRVEWAVLEWNEPAMAFYRGLGAEPVEGWTRYRWDPSDVPPPR